MPDTNGTGEDGTHFVLMVVEGHRHNGLTPTANRCFTFTPGPEDTMASVFEVTYAQITAGRPDLTNAVVTYFDVRPNKIL